VHSQFACPSMVSAYLERRHLELHEMVEVSSLHALSSLKGRSPRWDTDVESARASLSAAILLVLRLLCTSRIRRRAASTSMSVARLGGTDDRGWSGGSDEAAFVFAVVSVHGRLTAPTYAVGQINE
jgi:hypothetical protein